jgi:phosphatidylglycerophosphate synthase
VCDADMLTELGHIFAWVYGFVVCGDALDGIGARHSQTVSEMGARFDNHVDGLGMFVASVAAVLLGSLPGYYLLLSLAYFGFHLGLWWRQRRGMTVFRDRIMLSLHNRYFAGVHMCLLAFALSPSLQGWTLAVVATIGECLLLGCFLRDWLHVRGAVNPGVGRFNQAWTQAASFSVIQGSLLARASIGLSLVAGMLSVLPAWLWVVPIAVATGLFARTFAWAGLVAFAMGMAPLDFDAAIVLIPSLSWVAWLGSGPFSLARLDDGLYFRTISWRAE